MEITSLASAASSVLVGTAVCLLYLSNRQQQLLAQPLTLKPRSFGWLLLLLSGTPVLLLSPGVAGVFIWIAEIMVMLVLIPLLAFLLAGWQRRSGQS